MKLWKKIIWIVTIIIILAVIIAIPFAINESYKKNSGYVTLWGADNVLSLYGSLLGSFVTVAALVSTIVFTNRQNRKAEAHQRLMSIADTKKMKLDEKYAELIEIAKHTKETILLSALKNEGFWDVISNKAINEFPERIMECSNNLSKLNISNSDAERAFIAKTASILSDIINLFPKLGEDLEIAEQEETMYQLKKREFENKHKEITNKPEYRVAAMQSKLEGKAINKERFDEPKPKSKSDILNQFEDFLNEKKDNYEAEYVSLYEKYMEQQNIEYMKIIENIYNGGQSNG